MTDSDQAAAGPAGGEPAEGSRDIGLALSGGGLRAAFFHVGVLARLAELDLLSRVEALSTVSGGSIVGTLYYLLLKARLDGHESSALDRDDYIAIVRQVESKLLEWAQTDVRSRIFSSVGGNYRLFGSLLLKGSRPRDDGTGGLATRVYDELYNDACAVEGALFLHELADASADALPMLYINATETNAGLPWWFTPTALGGFGAGEGSPNEPHGVKLLRRRWDAENFPDVTVGRAVAASACVPGAFSSVTLDLPAEDVSALSGGDAARGTTPPFARLVDGGVLDNLGLAALRHHECRRIIASDGSARMPYEIVARESRLRAAFRSLSVALESITRARLRRAEQESSATLVSLGDSHSEVLAKEAKALLAGVRTDLDLFSDIEADALMAAGYEEAKASLPDEAETGSVGWRFDWIAPQLTGELDTATSKVLRASGSRWKSLRLLSGVYRYGLPVLAAAAAVAWIAFVFTRPNMDTAARVSLLVIVPLIAHFSVPLILAAGLALLSRLPHWLLGRWLLAKGRRPTKNGD